MKTSNYLRQAKRRHNRREDESTPEQDWQDKVIGKELLSTMLNIKRAEVDSWIKEGMPILRQGGLNKEWEFDLVAVKSWARAQGFSFTE